MYCSVCLYYSSLNLLSPPLLQMVDQLKALLQSIGVEYSQRVFETNEGIAGLGPEPFDPEARIFIIVSFENHPRELLCKVGVAGGIREWGW